MKTRTVTVTEGELLGPIDWSYDFASHGWDKGGCVNPDKINEAVEMLRQLTSGGEWMATTDGGWPRLGWGKVLDIGMYDGWPYWRPVPSVYIDGTMGGGWHSFISITGVKRK